MRRPILPPTRPARLHLAPRLPPVGTQPQPTRKLLHRRPLREVRPQLAYQRQRVQLVDPLDRGSIDPRRVVQRRPHVETGVVRLAVTQPRPGRQRRQLRPTTHRPQLGRDLHVQRPDHLLILFPHRQAATQFRHVLRPAAAVQRLGHLRRRAPATPVAQPDQLPRVTLAGQDRPDDLQAGHAGDAKRNNYYYFANKDNKIWGRCVCPASPNYDKTAMQWSLLEDGMWQDLPKGKCPAPQERRPAAGADR